MKTLIIALSIALAGCTSGVGFAPITPVAASQCAAFLLKVPVKTELPAVEYSDGLIYSPRYGWVKGLWEPSKNQITVAVNYQMDETITEEMAHFYGVTDPAARRIGERVRECETFM